MGHSLILKKKKDSASEPQTPCHPWKKAKRLTVYTCNYSTLLCCLIKLKKTIVSEWCANSLNPGIRILVSKELFYYELRFSIDTLYCSTPVLLNLRATAQTARWEWFKVTRGRLPPQLSHLKKKVEATSHETEYSHTFLQRAERQRADTLVSIAIVGTVTWLPRN